jgi:uncharacterized protein (TIGR02147 family)
MIEKSSNQVIDSIFEYDNYRHFLQEYFSSKKKEKASFSQRYFTQKAGFNAHNFCTLVMQGKRNLATDSIHKIIKTIGLKGKASVYFENLVYFNQTSSPDDKEFYYNRMREIGKKTQFYQLHKDQFFFYEKWYYPVIREVLVLNNWKNDFAALAKAIRPQISVLEAREAVELLVSTGMVQNDMNGQFHLSDKFVTSAQVPDFIKRKSRRDILLKGIETIDTVAPGEKYVAYSTIAMSKKLYMEVRAIMDDTRQRILALADQNTNISDEVYEVVFQVFPVTNIGGKEKNLLASGGYHG